MEPATFDRWLEVGATKVGVIVQRWWTGLAAEEAGVDVLKTHPDETAYDLFKRIRNGVEQRAEELKDVCLMSEDMKLVDEWKAVCAEGLSPWLLVWWLRRAMARDSEDLLDQVAPLTLDELVEQVHFEIFVMEAHDQQVGGSGATETEMGVSEDPNDRVLRAAQNVVFGWPSTDATPVPFRIRDVSPRLFLWSSLWASRISTMKKNERVNSLLRSGCSICFVTAPDSS